MRNPLGFCLGFCAVALVCTACVADGETTSSSDAAPGLVSARSVEDVARRVASAERTRLQAWCAEPGRTGPDVALWVVDTRGEGESLDVPCNDPLLQPAQGLSSASLESTDEPTGEAQQQLTPLGWGCFAAGTTLALASGDFCERHPGVKDCGRKFTLGGFGLATMCFFLF